VRAIVFLCNLGPIYEPQAAEVRPFLEKAIISVDDFEAMILVRAKVFFPSEARFWPASLVFAISATRSHCYPSSVLC